MPKTNTVSVSSLLETLRSKFSVANAHLAPKGYPPRQVSPGAGDDAEAVAGLPKQGAAVQDGVIALCL